MNKIFGLFLIIGMQSCYPQTVSAERPCFFKEINYIRPLTQPNVKNSLQTIDVASINTFLGYYSIDLHSESATFLENNSFLKIYFVPEDRGNAKCVIVSSYNLNKKDLFRIEFVCFNIYNYAIRGINLSEKELSIITAKSKTAYP